MKASRKILRHIRRIEREAYPPAFRQIQDVRTWRDLAEYCEGRPRLLTWETGYCLWTSEELVDLAATAPVDLHRQRKIYQALAETFAQRAFQLDAREETSWRLLCAWAKRGLVEIVSVHPYEWAGETFYEVEARFKNPLA